MSLYKIEGKVKNNGYVKKTYVARLANFAAIEGIITEFENWGIGLRTQAVVQSFIDSLTAINYGPVLRLKPRMEHRIMLFYLYK